MTEHQLCATIAVMLAIVTGVGSIVGWPGAFVTSVGMFCYSIYRACQDHLEEKE